MRSSGAKIDNSPRGRVERFASRRREDPGKFLSEIKQPDGYIRVYFEKAVYFTLPSDPSDFREPPVYRADSGYERPALRTSS